MFATNTGLRPTGLALGGCRFHPMASSVGSGLGSRASTGNIRVICVGRKRAQNSGFELRLQKSSSRVVQVSAKKVNEKKKKEGKENKQATDSAKVKVT
eukprot:949284-Prorocentrum_minimum.AAC.3